MGENPMKTKTCVLIGVGLAVLSLPLAAATADETPSPAQAGIAVEGLRMSLAVTGSAQAADLELQVALENVGEQDVTLNLGRMLANGKPLHGRALFPTNLRLDLTDAAGKSRELHFMGPNVAGRVDDYVVPLRVGSLYTLKIPFSKFWHPAGKEAVLKLPPGDYRVSARFTGGGATQESSEFIMNYWKGSLQSNTVTFKQ
jgi:hypothetical protein